MKKVAGRYSRGYGQHPGAFPSIRRNHPRCQNLFADWDFTSLGPNNTVTQVPMMYDTTRKGGGLAAHTGSGPGISYPITPWGVGVYLDGFSRLSMDSQSGFWGTNTFKQPFTVQVVLNAVSPSDPTSAYTVPFQVPANFSGSAEDTVSLYWNHPTAGANRAWQGHSIAAGGWVRVQYPNPLVAGTWYDLAVTVDGQNNWVIYQNGVAVGSANVGYAVDPGTDMAGGASGPGCLLGCANNTGHTGLWRFWNGTYQFIRLWTRVLSAWEIGDVHAKPYAHYQAD